MKPDTAAQQETPTEASFSSRALAEEIAQAAWEKKALGLKVLDMRPLQLYTDFLVICSGNTERQVLAIADAIEQTLKEGGRRPLGFEGRRAGRWVVMDYGDVVVHVFVEPERDVYGLESMWNDVSALDIEAPEGLERPAYY